MKKILTAIICTLILCVSLFFIIYSKNEKSQNNQSYYLVSMNENDVFDPTFNSQSNMQFTMPFYSPSLPIVEIELLNKISCIDTIHPFYSMFVFDEYKGEKVSISYGEKDALNKKLDLPIAIKNALGEYSYIQEYRLQPIVDYEQFDSVFTDNIFLKKFNSDSGVFITSNLYEHLELTGNENNLYMILPIQIPVIAEMKEVSHELFTANEYTVTDYQLIEYTVEVEGVIDTSYGNSFARGNEILVPYELTEALYSQINHAQVELSDNQMYWEPNCYIVKCQDGTKIYQLGEEIESEIGSCFVKHYDHGLNLDPLHYLFKNGDVLTK